MGDFTYDHDYRDRAGTACDADSLRENLDSIAQASSSLGWRSIQPESLNQFHVKDGQPLKQMDGGTYINNPYEEPWSGTSKTVAVYRFRVRSGSGVYCVASATVASSSLIEDIHSYPHGNASGWRRGHGIRFLGTGGEYFQRGASTPENCGGVGAVWAYQAQDHHPDLHEIQVIYTAPFVFSGASKGYPLRTNIAVFVVDR